VSSYTKWKCAFCGHIYDEALGDLETGVPPGTRLADLPEDWVCPDCAAYASDYIELK
jgi:rubredoxin